MSLERNPVNRDDIANTLGSAESDPSASNSEEIDDPGLEKTLLPSEESDFEGGESSIERQNEVIREHIVEYLNALTPEKIAEAHESNARKHIESFLSYLLKDRERRQLINASLPSPEEIVTINQEQQVTLENLQQLENKFRSLRDSEENLESKERELVNEIEELVASSWSLHKQELEEIKSQATVWDKLLNTLSLGQYLSKKAENNCEKRKEQKKKQQQALEAEKEAAKKSLSDCGSKIDPIRDRIARGEDYFKRGKDDYRRQGKEVEYNQALLARARDVEHYKGKRKLSDFFSEPEQSQIDLYDLFIWDVKKEMEGDINHRVDGFGVTDFEAVDRFQLEESIVNMLQDIRKEYSVQWPEYAVVFDKIIRKLTEETKNGLSAYRELNEQFSHLWLCHGSKNMSKVIKSGGLKNKLGHGQILKAWSQPHLQTTTTDKKDAPLYFYPINTHGFDVAISGYGGQEERYDDFTDHTSILVCLPELMAKGKTNLRFLTRKHMEYIGLDVKDDRWHKIDYLNEYGDYNHNAHEMTLQVSPTDARYEINGRDRLPGELSMEPGTKGWYIATTGEYLYKIAIRMLEEIGFSKVEAEKKVIVAPPSGRLPMKELQQRSGDYSHLRIRYYDSCHTPDKREEKNGSEFYYYYDSENEKPLI